MDYEYNAYLIRVFFNSVTTNNLVSKKKTLSFNFL